MAEEGGGGEGEGMLVGREVEVVGGGEEEECIGDRDSYSKGVLLKFHLIPQFLSVLLDSFLLALLQ